MGILRLIGILIFLLLIPACAALDRLTPAVEQHQPTAVVQTPTTEALATVDQETEQVAVPPTEAAVPTAAPLPEPSALPAPTLFATAWDDRELFRAGLIESEQEIVDQLTGAAVYHMQLAIDEPTAVSGKMEVLYSNQEETPLQEIYFHLFANQLGGSITVSDASVNGQAVQPEIQDIVLRVPLETALEPGEAAVIQMNFLTTVPPSEESTKYNILAFNEDILALAHFYPMIAAYDDAGWHIEPTAPHGDETYADMSHYLVRLTVPADQVVVASGEEIDRQEADGVQTLTIAAGPVRDFYLAMSDRFGVVSEQVGPVQINSYAPTERLDGAELALDAAGHAVRSFTERFGPYPYKEMDIVSTPTQALGIEYPGVFANALRIYDLSDSSSSIPNAILLESTTAHETAHQWFYNLVGNDQLNEPWLDEATAQYATWKYYADRYGEQNAVGYYDSLNGRWARTEFANIPIGMPAAAYDGVQYGSIIYGRGPIFLDELAQEMGQETFDAFMRDYTEIFSWRIATSEDFQTLAEEHCGCDLAELFDSAVYAN